MFTEKDLAQFNSKGIKLETIETQLENFKTGFPFVQLTDPAVKGNGIIKLEENQIDELVKFYDAEGPKRDVLKFVPASGAASRMFKHLFEFTAWYKGSADDLRKFESDQGFNSVYNLVTNIKKLAFYDELSKLIKKDGKDIDNLLKNKEYGTIISYVLNEDGMNYAKLPKGLLLFHNYHDNPRKSIEEHLVEAAVYAVNKDREAKVHFTVSPEHMDAFKENISALKGKYEDLYDVHFTIHYSIQKPSTDTMAVDMENNPFRENEEILFRPGGHGALIENLNDIKGDIIFVKNIDNIVPDKLREPTYLYKKALGGYLILLEKQCHEYLKLLGNNGLENEDDILFEVSRFAKQALQINLGDGFDDLEDQEKVKILQNKLNRPIRICGMVKNEGEPGGGPFWIKNQQGEISLQIVEKSQIDTNNPQQKEILDSATHFNPVDLVCSVKDYKGNHFELNKYVDHSTGFISIKSKDGRDLKAQELPGLWNGAMADWITLFVETPIITFNPVKTVNDLLRDTHQ